MLGVVWFVLGVNVGVLIAGLLHAARDDDRPQGRK